MLDIHSHILPGVDDGPADLDTSLAMLRIAMDSGTTGIVATPHVIEGQWLPSWEDIVAGCARLYQALHNGEREAIAIYPGAEVAMNRDLLERLTGSGPYCINGGRYMLVELPATHIPNYADEFLFTLQTRGITPIIAHPERHPAIGKDPHILRNWINRGILVQLNGTSLTGHMGERVMRTAELLLANNMVHCLGSDAHGTRQRTPNLTAAGETLQALQGTDGALRLLITNPQAIIAGQDVEVEEVHAIDYPKQRNTFFQYITGMFN